MGDDSTALLETKLTRVSGSVLIVRTQKGHAEATRMGRLEAGQSRWCIRHPLGTEPFDGTVEQVVALMKKRLAEQDAAEAEQT